MGKAKHLFALMLCVCLLGTAAASAADERVFYHAKIFTGEPEHPYAEAVAIRGDKIVAVGTRAEAVSAVSRDAEMIDLKGHFLTPGLIDSHCHAVDGGMSLISADVGDGMKTISELAAFVASSKKNGRGMRGDVIEITGLPLVFWSKNAELNARFNAAPYADQAVLLEGMDGHTGWANQALLRRAGIDQKWIASLDDVGRGYYGFDSNLKPNGFLVDAGVDKVTEVLPDESAEKMLAAGRAAVAQMHAWGITAWVDPEASDAILASYRELAQKDELHSHVLALPVIHFKEGHPQQQLERILKLREDFKNVPDVKVGGIKVFADGVVEYPSHTAVLSKPYRDGRNGELLFDPAEFQKIAVEADKQGMIVHVHAIGDRAVNEALNGIAAARKANGDSGLPHTITHLQFVSPEDVPRFHELGVIASFQLYWANAETDTIELIKPYIDPAIYSWQYPARSILDAGGTVAGASDWPVSTANVFEAIYQAETRKGPEGVLDANQRVPREAMLYAYTRNAARALDQQKQIGTIANGKQADFAVLDRDLLTVTAEEARDTKVLWTIVGGKTVFGGQP
jgi:predicted amidohydrolase YtcJ